tara:strand:+ start:4105 stop:4326 length:222 start_codon:yes stop_codon:yes gene_type:complete
MNQRNKCYIIKAVSSNNKPLYKTKDCKWVMKKSKAQLYKTRDGAAKYAKAYKTKLSRHNIEEIRLLVEEVNEV